MKNKYSGTDKKASGKNIFASSMILSGLHRLSSFLYRKLSTGFFAGIFTGYDCESAAVSNSMIAGGIGKKEPIKRISSPIKHKLAQWVEDSVIINRIRGLLYGLLATPMKIYGMIMFSFAFYAALAYAFKYLYVYDEPQYDMLYIITVGAIAVSSIGMLASRSSLGGALRTSPIARFILFRIVGLRTNCLDDVQTGPSKFHYAFLAGLLLGAASYFVQPILLIAGAAALIIAYLVLIKPEFGVLMVMSALPFLPTMLLVAMVLFTLICYAVKLMIGKRSLKFDLMDGMVLIFMFLTVGGGFIAVSGESIKPMLVYVAFMLGYFLVVNLIRSGAWIKRCVYCTVTSGAAVALYGLYQNFFGVTDTRWQDTNMFEEIEGRVVSTFENPNVLAEYLIMLLPLIVAMMFISGTVRSRFAFFVAAGLAGGCLIFTWSRGAWLGFMLGFILFLLLYSRKTMTVMLLGLFAVPFLPFVLPDSIVGRFTSIGNMTDSSTSYRVNIWRGVWDMIGDFWHSGIGVGEASFRRVYPSYSLNAIEAAPHSHNLFLQITVEIGIVGLLVFVAAMFVYMQSSLALHEREQRKEKLVSTAIFCGIAAVLMQGMTDYIWYNYRVFLMFWLIIGLGAAVRKTLTATGSEEKF